MTQRAINPEKLPATVGDFGVSAGIATDNMLFISGQTPLDGNFRVMGNTFEEQTRIVFDAITTVLGEAGFNWDDMVKMTAFVCTPDRSALTTYCTLLKEYLARYSSKTSVAHTYMLIGEMQVPEMMIEVEGIAVKQK